MPKAPVFDETYRAYLERIAQLDLAALAPKLGVDIQAGAAIVPLFGRPYRIDGHGAADPDGRRPELGICIILFKYPLMCPPLPPSNHAWRTFKDFRDAAPLVHFFNNNAQAVVSRRFRGRPGELADACRRAGGRPLDLALGYQVKYRFDGLPRIPVCLLFNDAEELFPAQCTLLFQHDAEAYLDMESLSMLGVLLARRVARNSKP